MSQVPTPIEPPSPELKSGFKSSEFSISVIVAVAGAFGFVYGTIESKPDVVANSTVLLGAVGVAFPASRTIVKRAALR